MDLELVASHHHTGQVEDPERDGAWGHHKVQHPEKDPLAWEALHCHSRG
jgi:hypothetical protein